MNIEKLAKHLKEFTLDEIEMIAECDCKTELEHLLSEGKIVFEHGLYKYVEKSVCNFEFSVFIPISNNQKIISFEYAINYFLKHYVEIFCKRETIHQYRTIFKIHIFPYFKNKNLNEIQNSHILEFYKFCKNRELQARRIKNILALLNQMIKYYQNLGVIDKTCDFQVRRLSDKTDFTIDKIILRCKNG